MEELQQILNDIISKYGISEEDANILQEALINIEAPEYKDAEKTEGEDFNDPYAEEGKEGC